MADSEHLGPPSTDTLRRNISSMMDGDMADFNASRPTAPWKDHVVVRQAWHEYHVIGDALRNEDLARSSFGDESFLLALRTKLADEPRVQAPTTATIATVAARQPARSVVWRWAAPTAVAAGFLAVASVLVASRLSSPVAEGSAMALAPQGTPHSSAPALASAITVTHGSGMVVRRDDTLDAYLRAHRESTLGSAASWAGAPARVTNAALVQDK